MNVLLKCQLSKEQKAHSDLAHKHHYLMSFFFITGVCILRGDCENLFLVHSLVFHASGLCILSGVSSSGKYDKKKIPLLIISNSRVYKNEFCAIYSYNQKFETT